MKIKVWDLPTRLFHWLLALCVAGAFVSSKEESALSLHVYFGEAVLGLVVFRIGYGFLGNYYARYTSFLRSPLESWAYLKALARFSPPKILEHNPVAAYVFGVLLCLSGLAALTGLFVLGGQERIGLLSESLSLAQGAQVAWWHDFLAHLLLAVIALHLLGALTDSILHQENLVGSMFVHGKKAPPEDYQEPDAEVLKPKCFARVYIPAVTLGTLAFMIFWPTDFRSIETKQALAKEQGEEMTFYTEECGGCHFAFPANLLPKASWERMMGELDDHFGDDATLLYPEDNRRILSFLLGHAAETSQTEAAYYLSRNLKSGAAPQRITELDYWKAKHQEIEDAVFKNPPVRNRTNCGACHEHALYGSFEDAHIEIPQPKTDSAQANQPLEAHWALVLTPEP